MKYESAPLDETASEQGTAHLSAALELTRGTHELSVDFELQRGTVLAVLGPNGAGKSTLLQALAGLLRPHSGEIRLENQVLTSPTRWVPPEQRRIGILGQDPMLFPHLTALENIAFGPRSQGRSKSAARKIASQWLQDLNLAELAHRTPAQLSGGQKQRIAIARALAARPELLLLDEPLTALDADTTTEIRQLLHAHIRAKKLTTLLVTHDVVDVATLTDSALVLQDGKVVEFVPTPQLLTAPRHPFAAAFAGLNLVPGTVERESATQTAAVLTTKQGVKIHGIAAENLPPGGRAVALFDPGTVSLYTVPPGAGSPRNHWRGQILELESHPGGIRARTEINPHTHVLADITSAAAAELDLRAGKPIHLLLKATEVRIYSTPQS